MSSALAILAVTALFAAFLAPLGLAAWKSAAAVPVAIGYAALLSATGVYQAGTFQRVAVANLDTPEMTSPQVTDAQCAEVLGLLDRAGAIIDRSRPPRLVVVEDRWSQLPAEGQQAVVDCVQRAWPRDSAPAQVETRAR